MGSTQISTDNLYINNCTAAFISFWPGVYHQFGSGDIYYDGIMNGIFDTFTEITGGPYRLVPVRCSSSTPLTLNFPQIQVYYNSTLVHTRNISTLTATEHCSIIYIRGFDTNSTGVTGFNLYWDAGHTTIADAWIYSDSG